MKGTVALRATTFMYRTPLRAVNDKRQLAGRELELAGITLRCCLK